ncbi:hypothetical protein GJ629_07900 [Halapricum sp. CBA1109]|uniref:DUF7314 family protein n=1 Tax=Halapricum sp. CBA1109 TaxID=2668068 RepID=UPI0012F7C69E|nr:hypothetical protein [Halapricum sp. CBA1109]MUV89825.1 hypothetical protein [Halapricum sp. CBA1109]
MADEFMKGFGILVTTSLLWMVTAGWYKTPSFEGDQLLGPAPEEPDIYAQLSLVIGDALLWFGLIAALVFWVVVPMINEFQAYRDERSS